MNTITKAVFLTILLVISHSTLSKEKQGIYWKRISENRVDIQLDWCRSDKDRSKALLDECLLEPSEDDSWSKQPPRINEKDVTRLKITSFNFIAYDVDITIEETEIKTYTYLLSIWEQLLNPLGSFYAASSGRNDDLDRWKGALDTAEKELIAKIAVYIDEEKSATPAMEADLLQKLSVDVSKVKEQVKGVADARAAFVNAYNNLAEDEIKNLIAKDMENIEKQHQSYIKAANNFMTLGKKSYEGYSKRIGRKQKGHYIDLTVTSKANQSLTGLADVDTQEREFGYLVKTSSPVLFHVGLLYANLGDIDYDVVTAATGEDFFVKTKDNDHVQHFSAFASMPIDGKKVEEADWYGTIGTDFSNIGDNIYAGVSYQVRPRWFVSAGVAYGLVKDVSGEVDQTTGNNGNVTSTTPAGRTLYQIAKEDREASWFISVSYQLF